MQAVGEAQAVYETQLSVLSEQLFKDGPLPKPDVVAAVVGNDVCRPLLLRRIDPELQALFALLYKELYFRHIFAKLKPTLEQRFQAFDNYMAFFALVLGWTASCSLLASLLTPVQRTSRSMRRFRTRGCGT